MALLTEIINKLYLKKIPDIQPGDTVRVHQKIKEGDKERIQVFEGVVLGRKHGKGVNATITVRRISQNVAVERIFPIHASFIEKFEVVKKAKVRRAKLYYLRDAKGRKARLKAKAMGVAVEQEQPTVQQTETEEQTGESDSLQTTQDAQQESGEQPQEETDKKEQA